MPRSFLFPDCVCPIRDVLLIRATLEGEDPEIYAFLGSSRLEEPINRFKVTTVFHGHAHNGALDGKTSTGIPVYNVSAPALLKTGKPYRIIEL